MNAALLLLTGFVAGWCVRDLVAYVIRRWHEEQARIDRIITEHNTEK